MSKSKIAYWILAVLLALAFGFAGFSKLSGNPMSVEMFDKFGYSALFMYFIGACELAGGFGLVLGQVIDRRLPRLAAFGLLVIMVGAVVSHLLNDANPMTTMVPAVMLSVLLVGVIYAGKKMNASIATV